MLNYPGFLISFKPPFIPPFKPPSIYEFILLFILPSLAVYFSVCFILKTTVKSLPGNQEIRHFQSHEPCLPNCCDTVATFACIFSTFATNKTEPICRPTHSLSSSFSPCISSNSSTHSASLLCNSSLSGKYRL